MHAGASNDERCEWVCEHANELADGDQSLCNLKYQLTIGACGREYIAHWFRLRRKVTVTISEGLHNQWVCTGVSIVLVELLVE